MESSPAAARLTSHVRLQKVAAVVNAASGSVGAGAAERLREQAESYGLAVSVREIDTADIDRSIKGALEEGPDALIVLAGDGTLARCAALCGPEGPLLAALPGGTMNMLPHALSGRRSWPDALTAVLEGGREISVSGGELDGRPFYVATILGAPALWADAREAVRRGKPKLAVMRARRALLRAFKGRLRFSFDGEPRRKAEAVTLMCPLVSRGLDRDVGLEAAVLDMKGAMDGFRLGLSTLVGGWRSDPSVEVKVCTAGEAWAHGRVPAIMDGEPRRLDSPIRFRFVPRAFRALAPDDGEAIKRLTAASAQVAAPGAA